MRRKRREADEGATRVTDWPRVLQMTLDILLHSIGQGVRLIATMICMFARIFTRTLLMLLNAIVGTQN